MSQTEIKNKEPYERQKENPLEKQHTPNLSPDAPASEKQRALLRLAIKKEWLQPNPFIQNYEKWEKLTAGEADKILASIPPERLGVLERELKEQDKKRFDGRGIARGTEEVIKQIGHSIEGGM